MMPTHAVIRTWQSEERVVLDLSGKKAKQCLNRALKLSLKSRPKGEPIEIECVVDGFRWVCAS